MKRVSALVGLLFFLASTAAAQEITVSPSSVTAYSQGATTAFLTFNNVANKRATDACFCGDLISAAPDIGFKCNPASMFGCLPVRYDQSRRSANNTYTDIMSIPSSVARRAYLDAAGGAEATFFYVRHFVSIVGGPDEFVPVVIRLSGNGASAPFSITNVKLTWGVDKPVILVKPDEKLPKIQAEISYTGTGRLVGRWEIVKPGEELPESRDLLTESTLPIEERGKQRRYTPLSRFNAFLPPLGRFILSGPELWRVPSHLEGLYLILLRIEATDDASASATGATGGVAGFAMPVLRYYVGAGTGLISAQIGSDFSLASPADGAVVSSGSSLAFTWNGIEEAAFYRIELQDSQDKLVLSATLPANVRNYRAPSWLSDRLSDGRLFWRVVALDRSGNTLRETPRRLLRIGK
ncbi:MAG: hypothetical protein DMF60_03170 [Acidobacteria bacterium]|nr:MAG: hypothetical protein DMF60_03170 [Acidobacteriota bacterium]